MKTRINGGASPPQWKLPQNTFHYYSKRFAFILQTSYCIITQRSFVILHKVTLHYFTRLFAKFCIIIQNFVLLCQTLCMILQNPLHYLQNTLHYFAKDFFYAKAALQ